MGSNVHLYNQSLDDERALTGELGTKPRTLANWGLDGLKMALGLIPSVFGGGMPPPANPGAALVNSAGQALSTGATTSSSAISGYGNGYSTLNVQDNKAKGDAWENEKADAARSDYSQVGQQVTIKTSDGTRSRLDIVTRDNQGTIGCIECKASDSAPLTKNQAVAFPLLESEGAVIVGKGKPGFEGGTVIPPTKVQIVRPPSNGTGK